MSQHITHDPAYNTLDRDDFVGMIETDRYADRSDAFDGIIAVTSEEIGEVQAWCESLGQVASTA